MDTLSKTEESGDKLWRIGEILVQKGWVKWDDLETALLLQKTNSRPLGEILVHRGVISQEVLFEALALQFGLTFVRLKNLQIQEQAIQLVPKHFVYEHKMMPLAFHQETLLVALSDPLDMWPLSILERLTGVRDIKTVMAIPNDIEEAIVNFYGQEGLIA